MNIRPMTAKDKSAVMRILQNTPEFTPDEVKLADEVISDYLKDLAGSGYFILVAEENSALLGYIVYGQVPITESTWEAYWLAVEHNTQGKGVGQKLMKAVEEKVKQAGGKLLVLETSSKPSYDRTNLFYIRLDYKVVGRIKDFYMIGDDQITYEKRF